MLNASSDVQRFQDNKWVDVYNTEYVSGHGDLYFTIDRFAFRPSQNVSARSFTDYLPAKIINARYIPLINITDSSLSWINYTPFDGQSLTTPATPNEDWPENARISLTFSRIVHRKSRIQLSLDFMIIVISFNVFKLMIMVWVLVTDRSEYLVTIGDAAASFLARPDPCTLGQCILSKEGHLYKLGKRANIDFEAEDWEGFKLHLLGTWLPRRLRYSTSLSEDRQKFFVIL